MGFLGRQAIKGRLSNLTKNLYVELIVKESQERCMKIEGKKVLNCDQDASSYNDVCFGRVELYRAKFR